MNHLAAVLVISLCSLGACGDDDAGDDAGDDDGDQLPIDSGIDGLTGSDGNPARTCGSGGDADCAATEYCNWAQNGCGADDSLGVCTPRPTSCPDLLVAEPTCACDGMVYSSACDAAEAGADLNAFGGCPVPQGLFACGYRQCDLDATYCERAQSDIGGEPDTFTCEVLPAACMAGEPTCACLAGEPCGSTCSGTSATGLTLTCLGG